MGLIESQQLFADYVGQLIVWVKTQPGWGITFGEAYRTPEMAEIYARQGKGIKNSLHISRLAIDINLIIDGVYHIDTKAYKPLGDFWKSLDPKNRWGGDFKAIINGNIIPKPDGNHFEYKPLEKKK